MKTIVRFYADQAAFVRGPGAERYACTVRQYFTDRGASDYGAVHGPLTRAHDDWAAAIMARPELPAMPLQRMPR